MQLRMIGRRAAGAFTLLGDVAQATGPVAYPRWEDLLSYLPGGDLALIVPSSLRGDPDEAPALFDDTRISVLTPREARGMAVSYTHLTLPTTPYV